MQNTQKKSPTAGKILKKIGLRWANYSKKIAIGGQNSQKISPAVGKIVKKCRLRRAK